MADACVEPEACVDDECPCNSALAGKASVCSGCPGKSACQSAQGEAGDTADPALATRMGAIRHKVLVLSGKGGCGKSTVAVALAAQLARSGRKVGLLDLDLCGPSVALMLGVSDSQVVQTEYGWLPVKPKGFEDCLSVMSVAFLLGSSRNAVVWRGPRKQSMILSFLRDVYWGRLDYLVIDTPPGTSDEHMTVVAALNGLCDGAVLVTTPAAVSLSTLGREMDFCRRQNVAVLGVVENMAGLRCQCCGEVQQLLGGSEGDTQRWCQQRNLSLLGSVPLDPEISQAADLGKVEPIPELCAVAAALLRATASDDESE